MVDTKRYVEWFEMARRDMRSAKILFEHDGDNAAICFHLQQSTEKYLKGYLIYQERRLQEGHSLLRLCKKAKTYKNEFKDFERDMMFLNSYYIETRYPAEEALKIDVEDVEECFRITQDIMKFIDNILEKI
ncbi:MAG: HEPN domain-containing protein [Clostridia bacterium]|jgi:HEPN domain-containing protein|nr:HEPN domain-containing protein [Clostridia bacterium]